MVGLLHGARDRLHHRHDVGDGADHGDAGGEPRALEMPRHLIAHDVGLLADLGGERVVRPRRGLVHHHRQRRLQRVREIADVGARALDDLAVGIDQRVGLARQRGDLDRERAFELLGTPERIAASAARDAVERRKPEPHLEQRGEQEHDRKHHEGRGNRAVERQDLVVELGGVACDRDLEAAVVAEVDVALDQPQPLVLRALHVALAAAVGLGLGLLSLECGSARSQSDRDEIDLRLGPVEPA